MSQKYVVLPSILSALALAVALAASGTFATAQSNPVLGGDVPTGTVVPYAGSSEPAGYVFADGRELSRTVYADLFAVVGTTYGAGNGTTTFNIPNLKGRFPLGKADSGTGSSLGSSGGALNHSHSVPAHFHGKGTLSIASSGSHDHPPRAGNYFVSFENIFGGVSQSQGALSSTGNSYRMQNGSLFGATGTSTHSHSNTDVNGNVGATGSGNNGDGSLTSGTANPPFLTLNYLIRTGLAI